MKKIYYLLIALLIAIFPMIPAQAGISVSIGINIPVYPHLVLVPGYPVYYDPRANSNYFFYDGLYWVYDEDNWYTSSWYNGPWELTDPEYVPMFVLRIPVRYYRQPPVYFRGWYVDEPPRWGEHWGRNWESRRSGWDHWDHRTAPRAAPLPTYQKQYSGDRYPQEERQHTIRSENYRYQPSEEVTRQRFEKRNEQDKSSVEPQKQVPQSTPQNREQNDRKKPQNNDQGDRARTPVQSAPQQDRSQSNDRAKSQGGGQVDRVEPQKQRPQAEPQYVPQDRNQNDRTKPQNKGQANKVEKQEQKEQVAPQNRDQNDRTQLQNNPQENRGKSKNKDQNKEDGGRKGESDGRSQDQRH